ncbi:MAG: hypothetical protein B6D77_07590 [gamma proteobacterium symbiont of Ctena orbiculata]|nr:MAG: hypothetical protein B6D77_07590 [gamma proteobacterium symbiont of Ctena orbiculata]PVV21198.1 MAG: hypothetical protein B6D78_08265 [gamma proteobacterium symbiont of Ctena orbiculata]
MNGDIPIESHFNKEQFFSDIENAKKRTLTDGSEEAYLRARGLRYVIEAPEGSDQESVGARVRDFLHRDFQVERLFEDLEGVPVPEELRQFYLIIYEGVMTEDLEQNPYEAAYELLLNTPFKSVEPDLAFSGDPISQWTNPSPQKQAMTDRAWALRNIRADKAWLIQPTNGLQDGEGISIAHLDTGWTDHVDLDQSNIDLNRAMDYIDQRGNAKDPMNYRGNKGHGTRTGSVIMSKGGVNSIIPPGTDQPGTITGVARKVTYVPVRCIRSVVIIFNSDVARAVYYATANGCDVISMSLGGRPMTALRLAIQDAVLKDLIVVCAAGNHVRFVVWPARYDETIALAASNVADQPWSGSSRGRKVDITAPGEDVWVAEPGVNGVGDKQGNGTSYATAHVAGVAGLWLSFNGKQKLRQTAINSRTIVQELFRSAIKRTARVPGGWNRRKFGAGIVNVEALLTQPLTLSPFSGYSKEDIDYIGSLLNEEDPEAGTRLLDRLLIRDQYVWKDLEPVFGHELANILFESPELIDRLKQMSIETSEQIDISAARDLLEERMSETFKAALGW